MKYTAIGLLCYILCFCFSCTKGQKIDSQKLENLMPKVVAAVEKEHVEPKELNDSLSTKIFESFIEKLDPQQLLFTQAEIDQLFEFKYELDDLIKQNKSNFYFDALTIYNSALPRARSNANKAIQAELGFEIDDNFMRDFSMENFSKTEQALTDKWKKKYKKYVLDAYFLSDAANQDIDEVLMDSSKVIAATILEKTLAEYTDKKDANFQKDYIMAYLNQHDVQSNYMTSAEKERWDTFLYSALKGVGISFNLNNTLYPVIDKISYGGPAWNSKQIEVDDMILMAGEDENEMEDLLGWKGKDLSDLLMGEMGTSVFLKIKKQNDEVLTLELKRDKIALELTNAFLLKSNRSNPPIAYIRLPRFYAGDEGSAYHMLTCLRSMQKENIENLILDLRDNKGGSSNEARMITSYFLDEGPIMHRKISEGEIIVDHDGDDEAEYKGNLLVLCNARSGSASELFSGNMKDYNRGLIVGSPNTYGKGSAQTFVTLEGESDSEGEELGFLKLTYARFYSGSGKSHQGVGIAADIVLPDDYLYIESGEKTYNNAISASEIQVKEVAQSVNNIQNIKSLKRKSAARIAEDAKFQLADENAKLMELVEYDSSYTLNFDTYHQRKIWIDKYYEQKEEIFSTIPSMEVEVLHDNTSLKDSTKEAYYEFMKGKLQKDPYIMECMHILSDMQA